MFRSKTCRFRDTRLLKLGNTPNDPHNDLKHLTLQSTLYILNTHPEAQISLLFDLPFLRYKVVENRKCIK